MVRKRFASMTRWDSLLLVIMGLLEVITQAELTSFSLSDGNCGSSCVNTAHLNGIRLTCRECLPRNDRGSMNKITSLKLYNTGSDVKRHMILFDSMPRLQQLVISGSTMESFSNLFDKLERLEELDINYNNQITHIDAKSFEKLTNLRRLRLHGLRYVNLSDVQTALTYVRSRKLDTLVIDFVGPGTMDHLKMDFFKPFSRSPLKRVVLTNLKINRLIPRFSFHIRHTVCLDLSGNSLSNTKRDILPDLIFFLPKLRFFDISYVMPKYKERPPGFDSICQEPLSNSTEVRDLPTKVLEKTRLFQKYRTVIPLPRNIRYVFAHHLNKIQEKFRAMDNDINVYPDNNLRYIDFSNFQFKFDFPVTGFLRLQYLNWQNCAIERLMHHTFWNLPSLKTLLLGQNKLGRWFSNGNATFALQKLPLESLDLSHNGLSNISLADFQILTRISFVNLSFNRIKSEFLNYNGRFSFNLLNLSFNSISYLPMRFCKSINLSASRADVASTNYSLDMKHTLKPFEAHRKTTGFVIDLTGNPLDCSCTSLPFIGWFKQNLHHFYQPDQYTCTVNFSVVHLTSIDLHTLFKRCKTIGEDDTTKSPSVIVAVISSVIFAVVFILVPFICYRYRKPLKYFMCFVSYVKIKRLWYGLTQDHPYGKNKSNGQVSTYDVFVLCSSDDLHFVDDNIKPILTHRGFRIVSDEDFQLDKCIFEQIKMTMENSACALLVLSKKFISSPWLDYEITTAILMTKKVIIVKLDNPPFWSMPASLIYLHKTNKTRKRYPFEHPKKLPKFWNDISKAILKERTTSC